MSDPSPEFLAQFLKNYGWSHRQIAPDFSLCAEKIVGDVRWPDYHQCTRKNGHGPHGAWCKMHDPVARKAKQAARDAENSAKQNVEIRAYAFTADCKNAIRAIAAGHNDPRGLAQSIIDKLEASK